MKRQTLALLIAAAFSLAACGGADNAATTASAPAASAATAQTGELPVIDAVLTQAPNVPPPIDRDHAAKVVVKMETVEKVMRMADGVDYVY